MKRQQLFAPKKLASADNVDKNKTPQENGYVLNISLKSKLI